MAMNYLQLCISSLVLGSLSLPSLAAGNPGSANGGGELGASRLIYPAEGRGVTLSVSNHADHPFLISSSVLDESTGNDAPFVVTPPLFRLDGGQRNILTVTRTGGNFPADREALNWMCVRFIPPDADSAWNEDGKDKHGKEEVSVDVKVVSGNCIKLMVRPAAVQGSPVEMADKVTWSVKGKDLTANNPTPFYMNIGQALFNGKTIKVGRGYIPPFSEEKYALPGNEIKGTVKWSVIGDYGEEKEKTVTVK